MIFKVKTFVPGEELDLDNNRILNVINDKVHCTIITIDGIENVPVSEFEGAFDAWNARR